MQAQRFNAGMDGIKAYNQRMAGSLATGRSHLGTTSLAGSPTAASGIRLPVKPGGMASEPAEMAAGPSVPVKPGRGFTAYMDEQMGDTGWKMTSRNSRGAVATGGKNRGQSRTDISSRLRAQFLKMSPEQRAKYDQDAEVLAGNAGRPNMDFDEEDEDL